MSDDLELDLDTVAVYCPVCWHDRAFYLGKQGVLRIFKCARCRADFYLQEREEKPANDAQEQSNHG